MAGRMGGERTTAPNLTLHGVDADRGLLLIKGAVPGPAGGLVLVRSAVKTPLAPGGQLATTSEAR
jgi:large subunit ribosomal protein L3